MSSKLPLPELLLIDKPRGVSSFGVIRELRRRTGVRKFGHAGTLDPLATGLMLIGVNQGTKLLAELIGLDKDYEAVIWLGEARTTGDLEGEVITEREYAHDLTPVQLETAVASLLGNIELPVSAYSAIKKDGVPMYVRARKAALKGELVSAVPVRVMQVRSAVLGEVLPIRVAGKSRLALSVHFSVGSGTYIRSLAVALGERLGYPAVLASLRRTRIGTYSIKNALTPSEVAERYEVFTPTTKI